MPSKPQLAIIPPTNRWDPMSRGVLTQAAAIGFDDILVHIGGNSLNPQKNAFVRELAARSTNVVATCYPAPSRTRTGGTCSRLEPPSISAWPPPTTASPPAEDRFLGRSAVTRPGHA